MWRKRQNPIKSIFHKCTHATGTATATGPLTAELASSRTWTSPDLLPAPGLLPPRAPSPDLLYPPSFGSFFLFLAHCATCPWVSSFSLCSPFLLRQGPPFGAPQPLCLLVSPGLHPPPRCALTSPTTHTSCAHSQPHTQPLLAWSVYSWE